MSEKASPVQDSEAQAINGHASVQDSGSHQVDGAVAPTDYSTFGKEGDNDLSASTSAFDVPDTWVKF